MKEDITISGNWIKAGTNIFPLSSILYVDLAEPEDDSVMDYGVRISFKLNGSNTWNYKTGINMTKKRACKIIDEMFEALVNNQYQNENEESFETIGI